MSAAEGPNKPTASGMPRALTYAAGAAGQRQTEAIARALADRGGVLRLPLLLRSNLAGLMARGQEFQAARPAIPVGLDAALPAASVLADAAAAVPGPHSLPLQLASVGSAAATDAGKLLSYAVGPSSAEAAASRRLAAAAAGAEDADTATPAAGLPGGPRPTALQALAAARVLRRDQDLNAQVASRHEHPWRYLLDPTTTVGPLNEIAARLDRRVNAVRGNPDDAFRLLAYVPGVATAKAVLHGGEQARVNARTVADRVLGESATDKKAFDSAVANSVADWWRSADGAPVRDAWLAANRAAVDRLPQSVLTDLGQIHSDLADKPLAVPAGAAGVYALARLLGYGGSGRRGLTPANLPTASRTEPDSTPKTAADRRLLAGAAALGAAGTGAATLGVLGHPETARHTRQLADAVAAAPDPAGRLLAYARMGQALNEPTYGNRTALDDLQWLRSETNPLRSVIAAHTPLREGWNELWKPDLRPGDSRPMSSHYQAFAAGPASAVEQIGWERLPPDKYETLKGMLSGKSTELHGTPDFERLSAAQQDAVAAAALQTPEIKDVVNSHLDLPWAAPLYAAAAERAAVPAEVGGEIAPYLLAGAGGLGALGLLRHRKRAGIGDTLKAYGQKAVDAANTNVIQPAANLVAEKITPHIEKGLGDQFNRILNDHPWLEYGGAGALAGGALGLAGGLLGRRKNKWRAAGDALSGALLGGLGAAGLAGAAQATGHAPPRIKDISLFPSDNKPPRPPEPKPSVPEAVVGQIGRGVQMFGDPDSVWRAAITGPRQLEAQRGAKQLLDTTQSLLKSNYPDAVGSRADLAAAYDAAKAPGASPDLLKALHARVNTSLGDMYTRYGGEAERATELNKFVIPKNDAVYANVAKPDTEGALLPPELGAAAGAARLGAGALSGDWMANRAGTWQLDNLLSVTDPKMRENLAKNTAMQQGLAARALQLSRVSHGGAYSNFTPQDVREAIITNEAPNNPALDAALKGQTQTGGKLRPTDVDVAAAKRLFAASDIDGLRKTVNPLEAQMTAMEGRLAHDRTNLTRQLDDVRALRGHHMADVIDQPDVWRQRFVAANPQASEAAAVSAYREAQGKVRELDARIRDLNAKLLTVRDVASNPEAAKLKAQLEAARSQVLAAEKRQAEAVKLPTKLLTPAEIWQFNLQGRGIPGVGSYSVPGYPNRSVGLMKMLGIGPGASPLAKGLSWAGTLALPELYHLGRRPEMLTPAEIAAQRAAAAAAGGN